MKNGAPRGTRLILLPGRLVERLRKLSGRRGVSVSGFVEEALGQALRAAALGTTLEEAVDVYKLTQIQKGAGAVQISRESLDRLIKKLYEGDREELEGIWREAGRWYGEYLRTKLKEDNVLGFFEKVLLASWNLDEAQVEEDEGEVRLRCASFRLSQERTELLINYVSGAMLSLGYKEASVEHIRGLAMMRFRKISDK